MILVTGATGHIGNVLVRELVERGNSIRALVMRGEDSRAIDGLGVELVEGDVLDPPSLSRAMQGVSQVFHLAGIISIMPGQDELVHRVNVEGTRNILAAARECGVRQVLYTSSIHAFRRLPGNDLEIDESHPIDPQGSLGAYDHSKAEATLEALSAARSGQDVVIVCPTGVIGPGDYRGSEMGQVLVGCDREGPQLYIDGGYDFVDVRDVARGMIQAAERGKPGECYILSGHQVSVIDLIQQVRKITKKPVRAIWLPTWLARFAAVFAPLYYQISRQRPVFTPYSLATLRSNSQISSAKARRELGYTTRPLQDTLRDTLQWHRKK